MAHAWRQVSECSKIWLPSGFQGMGHTGEKIIHPGDKAKPGQGCSLYWLVGTRGIWSLIASGPDVSRGISSSDFGCFSGPGAETQLRPRCYRNSVSGVTRPEALFLWLFHVDQNCCPEGLMTKGVDMQGRRKQVSQGVGWCQFESKERKEKRSH